MEICRATLKDAHAIAEIHVIAWQAAYNGIIPPAFLEGLSISKHEAHWREDISLGRPEVLIARSDDRVVGWVALGSCRDEGASFTDAEIWAIYVAPSHWSQGIGKSLWLRARAQLVEQGFLSVSLWVLAENQRATRFYRLAGFVPEEYNTKEICLGGKLLQEIRYVAAL
jgi:ribosomal protein S18 acetylase RimI-like enzyme